MKPAIPTTQRELVRLALDLKPTPRPPRPPVNVDHWNR